MKLKRVIIKNYKNLGKAFLMVDEFVSKNQAYVGARPKGENKE